MSTPGSLEWRVDFAPELTWAEAKAYAAAQGDGWRLPTITELFALVDHARNGPACSLIPDMPLAFFWTSSAYGPDPACAWAVNFGDGSVSGEDVGYSLWVRLVRDVRMP